MQQSKTLPATPHSVLTPFVRAIVKLPHDQLHILARQRRSVLATASFDHEPREFDAIQHRMVPSLPAENGHRMRRVSDKHDAVFRGLFEVLLGDEDAPAQPIVHLALLYRLNVEQGRERGYQRLASNLLEELVRNNAGLVAVRHPQRVSCTLDGAGVRPIQVDAIVVRVGDGDGGVEVVADAPEDVGLAQARFQNRFKLVAGHVEVAVENNDREQGGFDLWQEGAPNC